MLNILTFLVMGMDRLRAIRGLMSKIRTTAKEAANDVNLCCPLQSEQQQLFSRGVSLVRYFNQHDEDPWFVP